MSSSPPVADRPFLSVVALPEGMGRDAAADVLASAGLLDAPTLRLRLGREPPLVLDASPPDVAQRAAATIVDGGGDAFTFTFADLEALGPTLKIRDLRIVEGGMEVDLWAGPSTTLRRERIDLLVRATVGEQVHREVLPDRITHIPGHSSSITRRVRAARERKTEHVFSEKLDIHTSDSSVYQIDGDKFAYHALGQLRGHGDKANMDAMCELLSHLAPDEVVDEYFSLFAPPPGCERLQLPSMARNADDPVFAFYSRWAAILYRHVRGR
jgi:hypothetical protein